MSKILEVTTPFFSSNLGDRFEVTEDGKNYTSEYNEQFNRSGENGESFDSVYQSKFTISEDYAKWLIEEGVLKEVVDTQEEKFVNVFDEIDTLLTQYTHDLEEVSADKDQVPACLRVEKTTVLSNLIKVLTHLKSLKK